ncbi:MAG: hypothetical protein Q8K89_05755 [Actinomycetota bacterium]|nr:hypothetical protein [Actinomycetota bacterium]
MRRIVLIGVVLAGILGCTGCSSKVSAVSLGLQSVDATAVASSSVPAEESSATAPLTTVVAMSEAAPVAVVRKASKSTASSSKTAAADDPLAQFRKVPAIDYSRFPPVPPITQLPPDY